VNSKPSKVILSYIAGYVDGEGSIGWYSTPKLSLESCHPDPLKFIQKIYGGTIRTRKREGTRQWRTSYYLVYHADRCVSILRDISPYLIEKKEQAHSILEVKRLREKLKTDKKIDYGPLQEGKTQLAKK
jgi:hypothetical protein